MASQTENRIMEVAANELSSSEQAALANVPIMCLLRAAIDFVGCGVSNGECQRKFVNDVLSCFGVGEGS